MPGHGLGSSLGAHTANLDVENEILGTPAWLQRSDSQLRPFRVPKTFAVFTAVPEPTSALLTGLGLAGLGGLPRHPGGGLDPLL